MTETRVIRNLIVIASLALISACKAEKIEIRTSADDIVSAANGNSIRVRFEAEVGEEYAEVDDEKRELLENAMKVMQTHFQGAQIELDIGNKGYEIQIEGELLMATEASASSEPWFVESKLAADGDGYSVSLEPTGSFARFKEEMQKINVMISPDEHQPVEFRFSASSGTTLVGGAIVDGTPTGIARIPMAGQQIKILFDGGVWDKTSGKFVYIP